VEVVNKQNNITMGFEFKSDQEPQKLVDNKTTLSVNEPVIENLAQPVLTEEQMINYALQFIEENDLMIKFMIWVEIQEQLSQVNLDQEG
jgi:hypothetical protein